LYKEVAIIVEARMIRRVLLTLLCLLPILLTACAAATAVEPATFTGVRLHQSILTSGQYVVDISPTGDIAVSIQMGPGQLQRGAGQLTPEQVATLFNALKGWDKLQAEYPGDWQNLYEITYNDHAVTAHFLPQAPAQFVTVKTLLDTYGRQVIEASTRPATQVAPAGAATRP
jgi:hypothetical protein